MSKSFRVLTATVGLIVLTTRIDAQEPPSASKATAEHAWLAKGVGVWDAKIKVWNEGPNAPPTISEGVEEATMMPGGLWLLGKFDGKLAGAPFRGQSMTGYDPVKKKYVGVWVDSTDPHLTVIEGDYDSASKTETWTGKGTDPSSGKPYDSKMVTVHKGDDEKVFTFLLKSDETQGEYFKYLEIAYKRKSK